jgi:prenylcysteine oxidase/farnesylcysteine lyase
MQGLVFAWAILVLRLLVTATAADDSQIPIHDTPDLPSKPHRVAIIGAGPGGSSAAYYLDQFSRSSLDDRLEVTVFDANPRVGGRTTTVNALDDPRYPTELGASIFVEINHILYNASRDFGLSGSRNIYQTDADSKYDLGIWDGSEFVFKTEAGEESSWRGWWDIAKLLWRYGLSPIRTQRATKFTIGKFLGFYEEPLFPFNSLQEAVDETGLDDFTAVPGAETLQAAGVSERFGREIVQASTRVNYASNLGGIHGLETLVCMAIEGAMAVEGGNWQIFERMVASGGATRVLLNTTVTDVVKHADGTFEVRTVSADNDDDENDVSDEVFDTVILAAPYQFANITFDPPLVRAPTKIPYVSLHVTLFTSPHRLSPGYFGVESLADVPSSVLTTLPEALNDELGSRRGVDAVGPAGFWSISTLRVLRPDTDGTFEVKSSSESQRSSTPQYLYKIFSPAPLTGTFLSSLLDFPHPPNSDEDSSDDPLSRLPQSDITWLHEKRWDSYPYELPRRTFDNFTLCTPSSSSSSDDCDDLWYLSAMESFISTMETSALAGMNVARLIVDRLQDEARGRPA